MLKLSEMNAEIITIGDEILIGQITDTNSQWIGEQLNKIGISVYQISSIQDDENHILKALKEAQKRVGLIVVTGGLGPTKDDITKKTIAKYFNDNEFVNYPEVTDHIKQLFQKINHPYTEVQEYQAKLPSKATLLFNDYGTAPGMWFFENDTVFVSLPGVPYEMKALMTNQVLPKLKQKFELPSIIHKTVHTFGQGESIIAQRIEEFENNLPDFISLAYLPSTGMVRLRLSGKHQNKLILERTIQKLLYQLTTILSDIVYGIDEQGAIENYVGKLLVKNNLTISTAESMTAGKLAATIVSVPGASKYFRGSIIPYTASLKYELLGVSKKLIEQFTVVSEEIAIAMAKAVKLKMNTDIAISITGNAGPTTDVNTNTVGQVFIALAFKDQIEVFSFHFEQPRHGIINRTVTKALELLIKKLV